MKKAWRATVLNVSVPQRYFQFCAPLLRTPIIHSTPFLLVMNNEFGNVRAYCLGGCTYDRTLHKQMTWAGSGAGVDVAACYKHVSWIGRKAHTWTMGILQLWCCCCCRCCRHCYGVALCQIVAEAAQGEKNLRGKNKKTLFHFCFFKHLSAQFVFKSPNFVNLRSIKWSWQLYTQTESRWSIVKMLWHNK